MLVAKGRIKTWADKDYRGKNPGGALRHESLLIWRYQYLQDQFERLLDQWCPSFVGSEAPPIGGGEYSEGLFALYVQNMKVLMGRKVDTVFFAPEQLKLLAFEDGKVQRRVTESIMEKSEMIKKAEDKLFEVPVHPKLEVANSDGKVIRFRLNNDEADAFHCAFYAIRFRQLMEQRADFIGRNPLDRRGEYLGYGDVEWENRFLSEAVESIGLTTSEVEVFLNKHTFVKGNKKGLTEYKGIVFKPNKRFFIFDKPFHGDAVGTVVEQRFT